MKRVLLWGMLAAAGTGLAEDKQKNVGMDASEVGKELEKGWDKSKEAVGMGGSGKSQKAAMLENGPTFNISGQVAEAKGGSLSVQRSALPPAKLDVQAFTEVTLDGKPVESKYIPKGARVQARFQLDGSKPVALSIQATSQQATGGSGTYPHEEKDEGPAHERGETKQQEGREHSGTQQKP
jgi:hypothetical protein